MPTWNKRTKHNRLSKSMVFKTYNPEERDLFLELVTPVISKTETRIDSRLQRIELEISGSYGEVDNLQKRLRNLASYAYEATNPDKNGMYYYHNTVLTKLLTPPLNLQLLAACIEEFAYSTKVLHNTLATTANIQELNEIHQQVVQLRNFLPDYLNKDVERFLLQATLASGQADPSHLLALALESQLIESTETGYQFTVDLNVARKSLLKRITQQLAPKDYLSIENVFDSSDEVDEFLDADSDRVDSFDTTQEDVSLFSESMFEGGKIVFVKDGQETNGIGDLSDKEQKDVSTTKDPDD